MADAQSATGANPVARIDDQPIHVARCGYCGEDHPTDEACSFNAIKRANGPVAETVALGEPEAWLVEWIETGIPCGLKYGFAQSPSHLAGQRIVPLYRRAQQDDSGSGR